MATSSTPQAKLHFILAREAHAAVIFRRGPGKLVQIVKWNTDTDTFEPGQWFKGRIFEDRSDISPAGTKLLYFAEKITPVTLKDPNYTTHWTAVSKLPYLTALALWPNGDRTCKSTYVQAKDMEGGGVFVSDTELMLNILFTDTSPHPEHLPKGLSVITGRDWADRRPVLQTDMDDWTEEQFQQHLQFLSLILSRCESDRNGWEYVPVFYTPFGRLLKARIASNEPVDRTWLREAAASVMHLPTLPPDPGTKLQTLSKECAVQPGIRLIKRMVGNKIHDFKIIDAAGGEFAIAGATCADWDQSGRLVYASDGKVFSGEVTASGIAERELADFNGNKFEPIDSPEWAKSW